MGAMQRNKGATFERDLAKCFSESLGVPVKRNIGQARDGGDDITVGPLAVEAKRRKSLKTVYDWIRQAERAVEQLDLFLDAPRKPLVVARADNEGPLVIMKLDDFLSLAGPELRRQLADDLK
jgi:Holliday junction resolvase